MVSVFDATRSSVRRRVAAVAGTVGLAAVLMGIAGVTSPGAAAPGAQHVDAVLTVPSVPPIPSDPSVPTPVAPIAELGQAAADAALGLRTPYYEPPTAPNPDAPGTTIVSGADQPDPFMLVVGGRHYLFTSQNRVTANIPVRSGLKVGKWGLMSDALHHLPPWAQPGYTWAPDVHRFGDHYVLYFTASTVPTADASMQCIGDAYSTQPQGPYLANPNPFTCQRDQGGSIDPRTFVDSNGTTYLIWKSDNNAAPPFGATSIYSQPLSADGLHLLGQPTRIFAPDETWQGSIVEAPDLVLVRGAYYLFYSGNWFNEPGYAIGAAVCRGPLGPCADRSSAPLLASNAQGAGPGEESVFTDAKGVWLLYTPFRSTLPLPGPPRPVAMARLGFGPAGPYLAEPTTVSTRS
ncbi:MAG TPA: glycoside hydrolase family 43 protein [Acidimicrobiales bacterium]|nr:glycoside hydrolase family 43 protein [Acidimicrobiales bacterium]